MTLPNFLIIGVPRSGTTSLYYYLRQHPDVFMSAIKEPNHFLYEGQVLPHPYVARTLEEYEGLFDAVDGEKAIGEASVLYLNSRGAADRIRAALPGVRLIVSLRNPADRAFSDYLGAVRDGHEVRDVEAVLRPGERCFEASFYGAGLQRYFDRFPRARIKVTLFDDFAARPTEIVRELYEFLGVDPDFAVDTSKRHNTATAPRFRVWNRWLVGILHRRLVKLAPRSVRGRGYALGFRRLFYRAPDPFPEALRRELLEQYRDDIRATGELIGRDLSPWLDLTIPCRPGA